MEKIGGPAYLAKLNAEITELERLRATFKVKEGQWLFLRVTPYDSGFDEIFGPALSDFEKDTRRMNFFIHASFKLIDSKVGAESPEAVREKTDWYMNEKTRHGK